MKNNEGWEEGKGTGEHHKKQSSVKPRLCAINACLSK